ncbi:MAG: N-acetylglucosamine-6-phosphate deacetylase [Acidiphilium sp.]|nr:N-acetylglucosamine-6-phosphate deacetylase [Acidiphilium sp.]MDD4934759.1 N-acetylglucosamine-6-phosphate deacetylase [Acidiphilium sp.]
MIIAAPRLFHEGQIAGPGAVVIEDGIITAILDHAPANPDISLSHGILAPGLIDLHNNGAFGIDCAAATSNDFKNLCCNLAQCGVTSFVPTIITAPVTSLHDTSERLGMAIATLKSEPVAQMLGLHLEGPFLAPRRRGAHREDWLQIPDNQTLDDLLAAPALRAVLRLITIAPELPGAIAAIVRLKSIGVIIAIGHSDADATVTLAAIDAGASIATHVFTAMRPFHHRDPGIAGVALADPRLAACFITDAIHTDPITLKFAFAAAGSRAIAVTDSISLAGLPEGTAQPFGGGPAIHKNGAARRPDGTLTGATITLDEGIRRLIAAGIAPEAALHAATAAPATALNLTDRGRLAPGTRADMIWLDDDFHVRNTWIAGTPIHPVVTRPAPAPTLPLTETVRQDLADLDRQSSETIIHALLAQESRARLALGSCTKTLATLADAISAKLGAGGRLFYAGAGTSGRLAMLDAVECGPTFSLPPGVIIPLIAGGEAAISGAVEGAEDDTDAIEQNLAGHDIGPNDALIGIAASGATKFTLAAIRIANRAGALTACIANSPGPIADAAQIPIVITSGPEVLAGSTRLSAGTSQKIALNCLSTTIMIRLGKTYGPYMVDLKATNAKLRARATRIVVAIAGCDSKTAQAALRASDFEVKTAIVALHHHLSPEAARNRLARSHDRLRDALNRLDTP